MDCQCLIDKVTERICRLGARKLSYAGRMNLIKSVLSTMHNYWARIFILPKAVINKIDAICRKFLWHGNDSSESPALVSWKQVCQPRRKGGLGIKQLQAWNIALLGKYVWWIEQKADHLWVKWVHAIYIKQQSWKDYIPSNNTSWAWRRICGVKSKLKQWMYDATWRNSRAEYSVQLGYHWLEEGAEDVNWMPWIRNRVMLPKHSFFVWLVAQNRLLTQDRLWRMGIIHCNCCVLCGDAEESLDHLFFVCPFSKQCLSLMEGWLQVHLPVSDVVNWWLTYRNRSLMVKHVVGASLAHLMYAIWNARNRCRIDHSVPLPVVVVKQVKDLFRLRLQSRCVEAKPCRANGWINSLCQRV